MLVSYAQPMLRVVSLCLDDRGMQTLCVNIIGGGISIFISVTLRHSKPPLDFCD